MLESTFLEHLAALLYLTILNSIFSQSVDNKLDYEVSSAVREVKKYLHDREVQYYVTMFVELILYSIALRRCCK